MGSPVEDFSQVFDRITDAVIALDKEGRITYANPGAEKLYGSKGSVIGQWFWAGIENYQQNPVYKSWMTSTSENCQVTIHDCEIQPTLQLEYRLYPSESGVTILINSVNHIASKKPDEDQLKTAEDHLKKYKERFELFSQATNDMIWDWDLVTNSVWRNSNYISVFGSVKYDPDIKLWEEAILPEDRERVLNGLRNLIKSGEKFWFDEYRAVNRHGNVINILDRGYVLYDKHNVPCRMVGSMMDITERSEYARTIKENEEKYRNIFERASDGIIIHDLKGNVLEANLAAEDFSGYSRAEMQRMNIIDFLLVEDLKNLPIPFEKLLAGETTFTTRRVRTKSGDLRVMEVSSKMLPDAKVVAIIRDATHRDESEKALRNSELRFRTLANTAPAGIFETNEKGETIYVNDKLCEYSSLTYDELMGDKWVKMIHPEDRERVVHGWKESFAARKESVTEYRLVKTEGSIIWLSAKAIPLFRKDGKFTGYLGTLFDVTKEREAMAAVSKSEEKYRTLVDQATDAIYIVDGSNGKVLTVNPAASELSGYSEEELLTKNIYDFTFPEDLEVNPFRFDELQQGKTVVVERRFRIKNDRELQVESNAKMLSDGRILVFARDISDRIRASKEILKEKNLSDSIINSLPGIFVLAHRNGDLIRWNKNLEYISQNDPVLSGVNNFLDFFSPEARVDMEEKIKSLFLKGVTETEASLETQKGTKIPFYFNGWRIMYEGEPCMLFIGIDISEKVKSARLLEESYEDIRRLASHLTKVREEERRRIGREIHDELGQQLTAVKMDVAWIDKKVAEKDTYLKSKLRNIIELLDEGNKSVRRILSDLNPGIIENQGLKEALERQNRIFTVTTGIPVNFSPPDSKINLSLDQATCIFRVYQESLTNIMRHAGAGNVTTVLEEDDQNVYLTIEDDGRGFNTGNKFDDSFGILGMRERVLAQHGHFKCESFPGKGTKISLTMPLDTENHLAYTVSNENTARR